MICWMCHGTRVLVTTEGQEPIACFACQGQGETQCTPTTPGSSGYLQDASQSDGSLLGSSIGDQSVASAVEARTFFQ